MGVGVHLAAVHGHVAVLLLHKPPVLLLWGEGAVSTALPGAAGSNHMPGSWGQVHDQQMDKHKVQCLPTTTRPQRGKFCTLQHRKPKDMTLSGEASLRRTSTDSTRNKARQKKRMEGLQGLSDSQEPTSSLGGRTSSANGWWGRPHNDMQRTLVPLNCT